MITVAADGDDFYVGTEHGKVLKVDQHGHLSVFADVRGYIVGMLIHRETVYALLAFKPMHCHLTWGLRKRSQVNGTGQYYLTKI